MKAIYMAVAKVVSVLESLGAQLTGLLDWLAEVVFFNAWLARV